VIGAPHRPRRRALAACVLLLALIGLAPLAAPHDPTDLASLDILDSGIPPLWKPAGDPRFPLGTDAQGRCVLSAILHGARLSALVAVATVALSLTAGTSLGLAAAHRGGLVDQLAMRAADAALSLHPVLLALMLSTVARALAPVQATGGAGAAAVVLALAASGWAQYARLARSLALGELRRPYARAAWLMGQPGHRILAAHVLPNVAPALATCAVLHLAQAIVAEATLSFLGAGLPPTQPSLGGLVRAGADFLPSGGWWMALLPAAALAGLIGAAAGLADRAGAARPGP
jgi:peptide/nickel transport system permease protein